MRQKPAEAKEEKVRRRGSAYDIKRKQKNGYPQLLFRLVCQSDKGRICICAKSYERASDQ